MILILFVGTMALSLWAMWRVKSVYHPYNQGAVRSGPTGGEVAAQILRRCDITSSRPARMSSPRAATTRCAPRSPRPWRG